MSVTRPATVFDEAKHTYTLNGKRLLGISTVAKLGGAEDTWGIASAWGFRVGYEGAYKIRNLNQFSNADELRAALKKRRLTPWSKRDQAADRGTWAHDTLEGLAQHGTVPNLEHFSEEYRGHAVAVMRWYVDFRPEFVATEVQVTSERLGVAGRYDIEAHIDPGLIDLPCEAPALCLIDLKTSKGVYPTTHFPQLAGYELCRREMGFPPTDAQFILNTHPDGSYDFVPSTATLDDFEAFVQAAHAIRRVKARSVERKDTRQA